MEGKIVMVIISNLNSSKKTCSFRNAKLIVTVASNLLYDKNKVYKDTTRQLIKETIKFGPLDEIEPIDTKL